MIVLVTGGHGFVGSHLCARLVAAGRRVRILARPASDLSNVAGLDIEVCRGDLTDPASLDAAVAGVDVVFHLGAALFGLAEADLFRVNAEGTRHLALACARGAPRLARFVLVSSLAAAGPSPGGREPRTEEMPERPLTWYGLSKLEGERHVRAAGLPAVILRPPIVFGPRERDVFEYFRIAARGFLPVLGFADRYYSLVYVHDLVDAIVAAADAPVPPGSTYYVAGAEVVSWRELGAAIAGALGVRAQLVRLPEVGGVLAGRIADVVARHRGKAAIFSAQKVIEMRQSAWVCSPAKAARELGWSARTPLAGALAETARWYRDNGWL